MSVDPGRFGLTHDAKAECCGCHTWTALHVIEKTCLFEAASLCRGLLRSLPPWVHARLPHNARHQLDCVAIIDVEHSRALVDADQQQRSVTTRLACRTKAGTQSGTGFWTGSSFAPQSIKARDIFAIMAQGAERCCLDRPVDWCIADRVQHNHVHISPGYNSIAMMLKRSVAAAQRKAALPWCFASAPICNSHSTAFA